jgi:hypothetical protein
VDDIIPVHATAFNGRRRLASGPLGEVAVAVKAALKAGTTDTLLVFDDATGRVVDLDLRGTDAEVLARLEPPAPEGPRGRGRPRLGVVPREVTLLPRHWDWLNAQPGGASVALRKLVEEARRSAEGERGPRRAKEAAYAFMSAMAGDEPGYEEAIRALFAGDGERFKDETRGWPADVGGHAALLAAPAFSTPRGEEMP